MKYEFWHWLTTGSGWTCGDITLAQLLVGFLCLVLLLVVIAAARALIEARQRSAAIRAEQRAIESATRAFQEKCRARSEKFWRDFSGGGK